MSTILSYIFKIILNRMGWTLMSDEIIAHMKNSKYTICVFSHTSYWDFYLMVMYLLAHPSFSKSVNVLIKPQPFKYAGWILRRFGGIPVTRVEDKNGGSVEKIAAEIKKKPFGSILLISPKGTIVKNEWRSGYYRIAKALDAPLIAGGLDFEKKCVYVSDRISPSKEEHEVKEFLYKELGNIVPLVPDQEVMKIRDHNPNEIGVIKSWENIFVPILYTSSFIVYYFFMISLI